MVEHEVDSESRGSEKQWLRNISRRGDQPRKIRHFFSENFRRFSEHVRPVLPQLVIIRSHEESGARNLLRGMGENPKAAATGWPLAFLTLLNCLPVSRHSPT